MLEENYKTLHYGTVFKEFSPFFETYNEVKGWLESNGRMEKFRQDYKKLRRKPEELGPQVLTMDHLKLGFSACLVVAVVSLTAFIGELMWSRLVITFKEKVRKVFEEKREIGARIVPIGEEICGNVDREILMEDELIEVRCIAEENSIMVEDVEPESMHEVVVTSEMSEGKPASNHSETSQESHDDTYSIDELIAALKFKTQTKLTIE